MNHPKSNQSWNQYDKTLHFYTMRKNDEHNRFSFYSGITISLFSFGLWVAIQNSKVLRLEDKTKLFDIEIVFEDGRDTVPSGADSDENSEPAVSISKPSFSLVVMVISSRSNVERRKTIRETWAKNHENVIFIVGKQHCPIPKQYRTYYWECELDEKISNNQTQREPFLKISAFSNKKELELTKNLKSEKQVVLVDVIDTYHNLSAKNFMGYKWISENFNINELKWVAKCDDDVYIRIDKLEKYLIQAEAERVRNGYSWISGYANYSAGHIVSHKKPTIIAALNPSTFVLNRKGKRFHDPHFIANELKFKRRTRYPLYPDGGAAYIYSKFIFEYIIDEMKKQDYLFDNKDKIFNWPIEDAGFGVMMYRSSFRNEIGWFFRCNQTLADLKNRQKCKSEPNVTIVENGICKGSFEEIIFSHKLSSKNMIDCFKYIQADYHK